MQFFFVKLISLQNNVKNSIKISLNYTMLDEEMKGSMP